MNWKAVGAAVIVHVAIFTLNAQASNAQDSKALATAAPVSAAPKPAASPTSLSPGHALLVARVAEESGARLKAQALVQVLSDDAEPVYAVTRGSAATFDVLQSHRYTVRASVAGYTAAESSLQTFASDTDYQAVLKPRPSAVQHGMNEARGQSWRPLKVDRQRIELADGVVCPSDIEGVLYPACASVRRASA